MFSFSLHSDQWRVSRLTTLLMTRLDFTARGLVQPILTKGTLDDVDKFCEMMVHGKLPGRAVLKVSA